MVFPELPHTLILGTVPDLRHDEWHFSKEPILINEVGHVKNQTLLSHLENARLQAVIDRNVALMGRNLGCTDKAEHVIETNSPPIKQRYYRVNPVVQAQIDKEFEEMLRIGYDLEHVFVYLDDIVIVTSTFEQHLQILEEAFRRLREANLTVSVDKCQFFRPEMRYLGYVVNRNGLHVDPDKVKAMLDIPSPTNVSEVRRIVGTFSWYRRFVESFSSIIAPITALLRKCSKFEWTSDCDSSFRRIKEKLVAAPILSCPDYSKPFAVQTDASGFGVGAVLTQPHEDGDRVIAYLSRSLTRQERNFTTTERECLAVLWAIEKLTPYLEAVEFTVVTDHYSLLWLQTLNPFNSSGIYMSQANSTNFCKSNALFEKHGDGIISYRSASDFFVILLHDKNWHQRIEINRCCGESFVVNRMNSSRKRALRPEELEYIAENLSEIDDEDPFHDSDDSRDPDYEESSNSESDCENDPRETTPQDLYGSDD
ncbi:hypothetical protein JTB14_022482 [Gonioctena quinquepunctata]|nr:hypothetical protein JTB14_022482 [Gonioctena quinquepunctata]